MAFLGPYNKNTIESSFGFGYSQYCDWDSLPDLEKQIVLALPHGSGIDYDWHFERLQNGKLVLSNAYHFMNECGMYVGSLPFSFSFDVTDKDGKNPGNGRLVFNGLTSTGYAWVDRLGLRDYLEDILFPLLDDIKRDCPYCHNGRRIIHTLATLRKDSMSVTIAYLDSKGIEHDGNTFACWTCNGSGTLGKLS